VVCILPQAKAGEYRIADIHHAIAIATVNRLIEFSER
jgi:hypothetical protein